MKFNINDSIIVTPKSNKYGYLAGQEFGGKVIDIVNNLYIVKDEADDLYQVAEDEIELNIDNLQSFTIVNNNDGNDSFEVFAKNANDAAHQALEELGYWVAKED